MTRSNTPSTPRLVREVSQATPTTSRWRRWSRLETILSGLTFEDLRHELLDRRVPYDRKDTLLAALVRLASNDPEATIAIATCLLPGLSRVVRRIAPSLDPEEAWSVLIGGLCERVRTYPLDRRPQRIAANLIWDAAKHLRRTVRSELRWRTQSISVADERSSTGPELSVETLWQLAVDAGVLSPLDVTLINTTRIGGLRLDHTAALLGINYEAAKKRRQRAEAAWASWWAPEWCLTG